jgi:hypothetical protein
MYTAPVQGHGIPHSTFRIFPESTYGRASQAEGRAAK